MELFLQPETWISLLTLTFLEIILGVDNIIFISIVTQKLPPDKRIKGQNIGLLLALILRIILLLFIGFIMGLTKNILPDSIPFEISASFISVLIQIALLNLVFSFDSILTAIGIVKEIPIMIAAVVLSMLVMMKFTKPVSDLVNKFPSLQILALSFLIMIGVTLIMEGLGYEVEKSIIYVSVAFSFGVEILNIKYRKKSIKNS